MAGFSHSVMALCLATVAISLTAFPASAQTDEFFTPNGISSSMSPVVIYRSILTRRSATEKRLLQVPTACPVDFVHDVDFTGFTKNKCPTNASFYVSNATDSYQRCCTPFFKIFCQYADILNNNVKCADGFFSVIVLMKYDPVALPTFCVTPLPEDANGQGLVLNCDAPTPSTPPPEAGGPVEVAPPPPRKDTGRLPTDVGPVPAPWYAPSDAPSPAPGHRKRGGMHRHSHPPDASSAPPPEILELPQGQAEGPAAEGPASGPSAFSGSPGSSQSASGGAGGPGGAVAPPPESGVRGCAEMLRGALSLLVVCGVSILALGVL